MHVAPQAQFSPQRHPWRRSCCALWHPHVQVAPAQDLHAHAVEVVVVVVISGSFELAVLAKAGYLAGLKGEAISKKSPRIITEGGMPNIW